MEIVHRKCRECREIKELNTTNFIKRTTKNGWRGRCRLCHNKNERDKQEVTNTEKARTKKYMTKYNKEKPLERLLLTAKGNSKRVDREFSITIEDLKNLWEKQQGKCYYTSKEMLLELGFSNSVSIDRYNSSIGYTKDNIVLCQRKVNVMKNDATIEELIEFCKDVLDTYNNRNNSL